MPIYNGENTRLILFNWPRLFRLFLKLQLLGDIKKDRW